MKISLAQTKPIKGDIQSNIANHKKLIELAVANCADMIVFPELSLTGYEPTLAKELAIRPDDSRLDDFQKISDAQNITIGVGIPTRNDKGVYISMVLFQPQQDRRVYSKKYLHADEEPFFVSGKNFPILNINNTNIALAICYELSVPEHAEQAFKNGADIYIASVAKNADGVAQASKRLAAIALEHSVPVLMSNCVGPSDNFVSAGNSTVWNNKGELLGQLSKTSEGVLIFDTFTQKVIATNN